MSQVDDDARYTSTHEWAKQEDVEIFVVGISDHAQGLLGDIVFVELPEVGREVKAGEEVSVIESVKAASDIYSPLSGEIIEVNESLVEQPGLVNEDSYHDGWIFKVKPYDLGEWESLIAPQDYSDQIAQEEGA